MRTLGVEDCYSGYMSSIDEIVSSAISQVNNEEPFYVVDIQDILKKHKTWLLNMPRVKPFYAVKCNSSPIVLELLASLDIGFDCASKVCYFILQK